MTQNQLVKLKNRILNITTQLQGANLVLNRSTTEQQIAWKVDNAIKLMRECYELLDSVKTYEPTKEQQQKARKKKEGCPLIPVHTVIIQRQEEPTYNKLCRHYKEMMETNGKVEHTCEIGMDLCYCSIRCAYASNNRCSTKA